MKKITFFLFVFFLHPQTSVHGGNLITMTGEKWSPYNNYVVDMDDPGFMFEIVQAIFDKKDIIFRYTEEPWARAIVSTREGKFSALIGPARGDAPDLIFPDEPIGFTINSFFVRNDSNWTFKGMNSLSKIKLGVLKSMTYGKDLDNYIKTYKDNSNLVAIIFGRNYLKRNFIKLKAGRIDATIDDLMVIRYFLQQSNQTKLFKKAGTIHQGYGIYIAFSPKYPRAKEMADVITLGVRQLRASGKLDSILNKYGARDWK